MNRILLLFIVVATTVVMLFAVSGLTWSEVRTALLNELNSPTQHSR